MQTVMVTGANRGIGLELARQYADKGYRVFACCRTPAGADELSILAEQSESRLTIHRLDVTSPNDISDFADQLGSTPLRIMIHNAGIFASSTDEQAFENIDVEAWRHALDVMLLGPFCVTRALLRNLSTSDGAKVMTISSESGASTWHTGGLYAYASAKAAVNRVMQGLAIDLMPRNITVNMIHPGFVQTRITGFLGEITPAQSATGIISTIDRITLEDTGKFFKFDGTLHPR